MPLRYDRDARSCHAGRASWSRSPSSPSSRRCGTDGATASPTVPTATPAPTSVVPASPSDGSASPGASPGGSPSGEVRVALAPVVDGLDSPIWVQGAGDGSGRAVRRGAARPDPDRARRRPRRAPFLDITDRVTAGGERGLLGVAFPPGFGHDRPFVYVHYSGARRRDHVLSEFRLDGGDPDRADPASERVLLVEPQPYANHNGGWTGFDPDGMLLLALGDGGAGGDPENRASDLSSPLGKILRDRRRPTPGDGRAVRDPGRQPVRRAATGARPEILHYGLRNPFRDAFDPETGDLWIGDVGQGAWEEVDVARAGASGLDFGWRRWEGRHCYRPLHRLRPGGRDASPWRSTGTAFGCSVIGGVVYHGEAIPALRGDYLFSDYCSGTLWAIDAADRGSAGARGPARDGRVDQLGVHGRRRRGLPHRPGRAARAARPGRLSGRALSRSRPAGRPTPPSPRSPPRRARQDRAWACRRRRRSATFASRNGVTPAGWPSAMPTAAARAGRRAASAMVSARRRASATAARRASVAAGPSSSSRNRTPSRPVAPASRPASSTRPTRSRSRTVAAIRFVTVNPVRSIRAPSCSQVGATSRPAVRRSSAATPAASRAARTAPAIPAAAPRASTAVGWDASATKVASATSGARVARPTPETVTVARGSAHGAPHPSGRARPDGIASRRCNSRPLQAGPRGPVNRAGAGCADASLQHASHRHARRPARTLRRRRRPARPSVARAPVPLRRSAW